MIKKIAWNTFKQTGNIDTYLELKQIQNLEQKLQKVEPDGNNKNKGDNNS
ncbi:MAG: YqzL family protein [Clostridia bacterium]|nr:YqzL family protein [Clostridia bacterium]